MEKKRISRWVKARLWTHYPRSSFACHGEEHHRHCSPRRKSCVCAGWRRTRSAYSHVGIVHMVAGGGYQHLEKEVTVSINVLHLGGVLAGFPAGHGLTPKVTLDFALATRIAGLIATTMLDIRWGLGSAGRRFARINAVILLRVVCCHHH